MIKFVFVFPLKVLVYKEYIWPSIPCKQVTWAFVLFMFMKAIERVCDFQNLNMGYIRKNNSYSPYRHGLVWKKNIIHWHQTMLNQSVNNSILSNQNGNPKKWDIGYFYINHTGSSLLYIICSLWPYWISGRNNTIFLDDSHIGRSCSYRLNYLCKGKNFSYFNQSETNILVYATCDHIEY